MAGPKVNRVSTRVGTHHQGVPLAEYRRSGLTFRLRDEGPPAGEPVVLLHGFPQDGSAFGRIVPLLHEAGLRTLVPDQRGYSPSARPRPRSAYARRELVADVLALLDDRGICSAHVVGHDWGGFVAWSLAAAHPDRVRTLTSLSAPHPLALRRALLTTRQAAKSWYIAAFQVPVVPELVVPHLLPKLLLRSGLPASDVDQYLRRLTEPGAAHGALQWYRALAYGQRHDPLVRVPTTYLWGRHDIALGEAAARLTRRYVCADYRFLAVDAGHWLPETRPGLVARVVADRCRAAAAPGARPTLTPSERASRSALVAQLDRARAF